MQGRLYYLATTRSRASGNSVRGAALLIMACLVSVLAKPSAAEEGSQHLLPIFESGWNGSPESTLQVVADEYHRVKRKAPMDCRVPYAAALVCIKQGEYQAAQRLIDETLRLDANNVQALEAGVWIEVQLTNYDVALTQLLELLDRLKSGESESQDTSNLSRTLGGLTAYLDESPLKSADPARIANVKRTALEILPDFLKKSFVAGYSEVATLESQLLALNEAKDLYVARIQLQMTPLRAEYAQLSAEATSLQLQIRQVNVQVSQSVAIVPVPQSGHSSKSGHGSSHYSQGGSSQMIIPAVPSGLVSLRTNLLGRFQIVQARGIQLERQSQVLQYQLKQAISGYKRQVNTIRREQLELGKAIQRCHQQEQRVKQPSPEDVEPVAVRECVLVAAYPFPLERAKAHVLRVPKRPTLDAYRALLMSIGRLPVENLYHLDQDHVVTSRDAIMILSGS